MLKRTIAFVILSWAFCLLLIVQYIDPRTYREFVRLVSGKRETIVRKMSDGSQAANSLYAAILQIGEVAHNAIKTRRAQDDKYALAMILEMCRAME